MPIRAWRVSIFCLSRSAVAEVVAMVAIVVVFVLMDRLYGLPAMTALKRYSGSSTHRSHHWKAGEKHWLNISSPERRALLAAPLPPRFCRVATRFAALTASLPASGP